MRFLLIFLMLCSTVAPTQSTATSDKEGRLADESVLRLIVADNTAAYNRRDAAAMTSHMADDADHINVAAEWIHGKDEFHRSLVKYFSSPRPTTSDSVEKIRFLSAEAALAIVRRQYKSEAGMKTSLATYVFQKIAGEWKIVAFQNTFEQPKP